MCSTNADDTGKGSRAGRGNCVPRYATAMRLLTVRTMWRVLNRLVLVWLAKETCKTECMSLIF